MVPPSAAADLPNDAQLLAALRQGDEAAFAGRVDRCHASLVRVALLYVAEQAVAEEVAQETWLAVLKGLPRFEGRSSLKTWLFAILSNRAKTRAQRENRTVPFSALDDLGLDQDEPAVEAGRFGAARDPRARGHWALKPASWDGGPRPGCWPPRPSAPCSAPSRRCPRHRAR